MAEKLIAVGAFLKWCRDIQGYLPVNPMAVISVAAESISYAAFTPADLQRVFYSTEYQTSTHGKCWQFWISLIAPYTGARQSDSRN